MRDRTDSDGRVIVAHAGVSYHSDLGDTGRIVMERAIWKREDAMTEQTHLHSTDDDTDRLALGSDSPVEDVVDAVRGWIDSAVPAAWVEAGRRGGPAEVRKVRTRADYEAWYPVFGPRAWWCHLAPSPTEAWTSRRTVARRIDEELRPFNLGRLNPLGSQPGRPRPVRPRHRGAAPALSCPPIVAQRGDLVPALQRARGRAPTWPRSPPGPSATATSGWSRARRSGPPAPSSPTGASCWPAPTPTCPSAQGITYFLVDMHQPGRRRAPAART